MIKRLCIIGVGLIGGSLARALKSVGCGAEVVGCGRNQAHLQRALDLGVIDRFEQDPARAVIGADMIVLAMPLGAMEAVMRAIAGHVEPDAIITDVASAKGGVVTAVQAAFGEVPTRFVPGHPIAGTEKSGVEASFAELYRERRVILTPLANTAADAVAGVRGMWEQVGAEVVEMTVVHHDEVLAATSHLPHMLAFVLVDTLARMHEHAEIFRYAAGGFRDFTRIASSDPVMWRDICLGNRDAIAAMIDRFLGELMGMRDAIVQGDAKRIEEMLKRAKEARDKYCE